MNLGYPENPELFLEQETAVFYPHQWDIDLKFISNKHYTVMSYMNLFPSRCLRLSCDCTCPLTELDEVEFHARTSLEVLFSSDKAAFC